MHVLLIAFLALVPLACQNSSQPSPHSAAKVAAADSTLNAERARLKALRDSLPHKIRQNLELGLSREQAEAIEQALIQSQIAIVNAAEQNLKLQKALHDSLRKYNRQ